VKIDAITYGSHNPYAENHRVSRLRENLTSGSEGEGLETGQRAPRQSFTRQLFFKWIKQHLRIKAFYGTTENAVKTQIWIAVSVYILVAIVKKQLRLEDMSLYTILQILSVTLFEKTSLLQILTAPRYTNINQALDNQLKLFES
jgi:hypothetical protein